MAPRFWNPFNHPRVRRAGLANSLKPLLVLAFVATNSRLVVERVTHLGVSLPLILYLALFLSLTICLVWAASTQSTPLRWLYAIGFAASAVFADSYRSIANYELSYDNFINMLNAHQFLGDALSQHSTKIAHAALRAALLLFGIGLEPRPLGRETTALRTSSPVLGLLALSGMLYFRGGDGAKALPTPYLPLAYGSLFAYEAATNKVSARQPVSMARDGGTIHRDIVLIVDESVSGNYLDLNSSRGVESGLVGPPAAVNIFNYGYAASITNCSAGTNVTLRHGGTRQDYRHINAIMPSIWEYAKAAGMRTIYIDAQRTNGDMQNMMGEEEKKWIDEFKQFDDVPVLNRDHAAANEIIRHLNNSVAEFIYVNKLGAHFPVKDKYPESFAWYQPALPRGGHDVVADTGDRTGFKGRRDEWRLYRNSYRNTLLWNVRDFFHHLFVGADLSRATLIYTSDHGQDLHEHGNSGTETHCSAEPQIEEGAVPLVVIEGSEFRTLDWATNAVANRNHTSHYNIFPTLLTLMGYKPDRIRDLYGEALTARLDDPLTFNILFNARLGLSPKWRTIELENIVQPPDDSAAGR